MKVLFVSKHLPYRADSGITIRILNLLNCLSTVCDVACAYIVDAAESNEQTLRECRIDVVNYLIESRSAPGAVRRYAVHLLELFTISGRIKTAMAEIVEKERPDIVWLEFGYIGHFVPFMKRFGLPVVYGSHNSQFKLDFGIWKSNRSIRYRLKMAPFVLLYFMHERLFFRLADLVLCISRQDLRYYGKQIPPVKLQLMPFIFDDGGLASIAPFPTDYPYIYMVGSLRAYQNYSAAIFALEQIWPILLRKNSRLRLYIVGELPEEGFPEYRRLLQRVACTDRVFLTGRVESVIPFAKGALANLVPLSIGSGIRTKIIESVACGTPVVSTSIGAEGLPFVDGESIFIADTAAGLAEKVLLLLNDAQLRDKMAEKAYRKFREELSNEAGTRIIGAIFANMNLPGRRPVRAVNAGMPSGGQV